MQPIFSMDSLDQQCLLHHRKFVSHPVDDNTQERCAGLDACTTQHVLLVRVCTATRLSLQPANPRSVVAYPSPPPLRANNLPTPHHHQPYTPPLPPAPCSSVRFALHRSRIATECEMLGRIAFPNLHWTHILLDLSGPSPAQRPMSCCCM